MRELFTALSDLESRLMDTYGVSLNEAMVLCSIGNERVSAGVVIERTGLSASHASKVLGAAEKKGFLTRVLGEQDKRQMYFTLTEEAENVLTRIKDHGVEVPDVLLPLFKEA